MNIDRFGKIETVVCDECWNDAMERAWDAGASWLDKDEDGDLVITASEAYSRWHTATKDSLSGPCLVVDNVCDFGRDNIFKLCPGHLSQLVDQVLVAVVTK